MTEMPDPIAQFDQAIPTLRLLAQGTWAVYDSHVQVGFSKRQAFTLARMWFMATAHSASASATDEEDG